MVIRQAIVTVAGHVDHGKTSILDRIRQSSVAEGEAGGITQKISFTLFPIESIHKICPLIKLNNIALEIPGFLFIDTPGHAAFTNLRKRGGNLADLSILVIDINEGLKPQTVEVIQILKLNKVPFIIALNKVDNISAWRKQSDSMKENIESQANNVSQDFDQKLYTLIASLNSHGFEADLFYNINDFTKKVALIPCSAKTGEGLQELIFTLIGLSQKFLKKQLELEDDARGVVLEVKKDKATHCLEAILYDGSLKNKDEIAIASFAKTIITKIRGITEIQPMSNKFKPVDSVNAATGIRLNIIAKDEVLPGMPFRIYHGDIKEVEKEFEEEISEEIKTDGRGIVVKADSLGSLEALLLLLKQENIKVLKAGIGDINKSDIVSAKANLEISELDAVVLGFNVKADAEIREIAKIGVKIITEEVVYKLIDFLKEFRLERQREIERQRLLALARISKMEIMHEYIFRNTKPAVFGVKILGGKIIPDLKIISDGNVNVGRIKKIQSHNKSVKEANLNEEVAISIPGVNFERQLKDMKYLYSEISEKQFKAFKKNKDLLTRDEVKVLQEIAEIKRKERVGWGV